MPMAAPSVVATFGCFAYARPTRRADPSPLPECRDGRAAPRWPSTASGERRAELAALFAHVKRTLRPPLQVRGVSWLYNLDAYRRLFPISYLATAHVAAERFQHMPLWGQFVDRHGAMKEQPTRQFLERLERQSSLDGLDAVLSASAARGRRPGAGLLRLLRFLRALARGAPAHPRQVVPADRLAGVRGAQYTRSPIAGRCRPEGRVSARISARVRQDRPERPWSDSSSLVSGRPWPCSSRSR